MKNVVFSPWVPRAYGRMTHMYVIYICGQVGFIYLLITWPADRYKVNDHWTSPPEVVDCSPTTQHVDYFLAFMHQTNTNHESSNPNRDLQC